MISGAERFKAEGASAPKVVTDLDAILESPGAVRLHGEMHKIEPVLVSEFFAFANALALVQELQARESVTVDEIVDAYWGLINPVCPTITREHIRKCTAAQVTGLIALVQEHVMGKLTDEKKKALMANPGTLAKPV